MENKNQKIYLEHILDEILRIEIFIDGWDKDEFLTEDISADHYAVVRGLEIIGEAASKVKDDFKENHKELPWRDMIDMRNKIIHDYLNVDYAVVWDTIQSDLPMLKKQIQKILG